MQNHWNDRFSSEEYVYGKEPNNFLKMFFESNQKLFKNPVLMLGDGEGRNGVFLATKGMNVTSLDYAIKGLEKAEKLAKEKNVQIKTILADVNKFNFGENRWGTIVLIYLHLNTEERLILFEKIKKALLPGGLFFVEAFSKKQLNYNSGGPKDYNLLFDKIEIEKVFQNQNESKFEIIVSEEKVVTLHEGRFHEGEGAVVRFICKKT